MTRSPWAAFFDDHAPRYDDNVFTRATDAEVDFLVAHLELSPGARILDIGCGTGRHTVALARRGYVMTGLDLSAGMLARARQRAQAAGVEVTLIEGDATRFAFDRPFDAALCLCEGAFGLLGADGDPLEQPLAVLGCCARALKAGAPAVFTVLNLFRLARAFTPDDVESGRFDPLASTERSELAPPGHVGPSPLRERAFTPTELRLMFTVAGFDVLSIGGGTAGNWGERPLELDEYEIMVRARRTVTPPRLPGLA